MKKNFILIILMVFLFSFSVYAQESDYEIPSSISNNQYYLESIRLNKLAEEVYEIGDYDAATGFAQESIRYTQLSNEYVSSELIKETERLLVLAESDNVPLHYPYNYNESKYFYGVSLSAHEIEEWKESIEASMVAINLLLNLETGRTVPLPAQYTVREWISVKDCLWNIAGYSWVYGDPFKWRILYDANKSKLPEPDNPNLIEPGLILDIPSIKNEVRRGMWSPHIVYETR